jgi:hypothetical protein
MEKGLFRGPLFIVGLSRSGTTLLRDLLNRHPQIRIPFAESHFIPFLIHKYKNPPDIARSKDLKNFFYDFTHTTFYWRLQEKKLSLDFEYFKKHADISSWDKIFEFIFKYFLSGYKDTESFIWGDKTPRYLNHMYLLKEIFKEAKFIHIIRDPRDRCLSVTRRWGFSILRAAEIWRNQILSANKASRLLGQDYIEIKYESLIEEPEMVLKRLCYFIGCQYYPEMKMLEKPIDTLSDHKQHDNLSIAIDKNNKDKFKTFLSMDVIKRIEEIVLPAAKQCGYKIEYAEKYSPMNPIILKTHVFFDKIRTIMFYHKVWGLKSLIYLVRFRKIASLKNY